MPSRSELTAARTEGSSEGLREWVRLSSNPAATVDIFQAIQDAGVWLMFQPLGNLFGAFERVEGAAGILINSNHPLGLQRYTAAHEFGHFVMDHQYSADSPNELYADEVELQEAAAQAFAADLLMPVPVVNHATKRLGISDELTHPENVYRLAVELGTSYRATVTQLNVLHLIDFAEAQSLRTSTPLDVKRQLLGGERPENARADVWSVTDKMLDTHDTLSVQLGDELVFDLEEIPSSGYLWELGSVDGEHVETTIDLRVERTQGNVGAVGRRLLGVRTSAPGTARIGLGMSRPWLDGAPVRSHEVIVAIEEPLGADAGVGLSSRQLDRMLA